MLPRAAAEQTDCGVEALRFLPSLLQLSFFFSKGQGGGVLLFLALSALQLLHHSESMTLGRASKCCKLERVTQFQSFWSSLCLSCLPFLPAFLLNFFSCALLCSDFHRDWRHFSTRQIGKRGSSSIALHKLAVAKNKIRECNFRETY